MVKKQKFIRTDFAKYSKLGVRRKKKQVYRKAKGTDNKIRLKMKGHVRNVSIGFRSAKKTRGMIMKLKPVMIYNVKDLNKINKDEIGVVAAIGNKKKIEIAKEAQKQKIRLANLNPKIFLENHELKFQKRTVKKEERKTKRLLKDKKARDKAEKEAKKKKKEEKANEKKEEKNTETKEETKEETKQVEKAKPLADNSSKKQIKSNNYGRGN